VGVTGALGGDAVAKVSRTVHRWFEDTGAFTGFAVALFVVGTLFVLAEVQSPSLLQWTGTAVHDVQSGGIAYYSFRGQNYTLNVDSPEKWSSTVYLDPGDPSTAMFANTLTRFTEAATVAGPYAGSVILLGLGFARRSRRRRLNGTSDSSARSV
jgi:hypothetical protein